HLRQTQPAHPARAVGVLCFAGGSGGNHREHRSDGDCSFYFLATGCARRGGHVVSVLQLGTAHPRGPDCAPFGKRRNGVHAKAERALPLSPTRSSFLASMPGRICVSPHPDALPEGDAESSAVTASPERPRSTYWLTRFLFLRMLGGIYFVAFLSLS